MVYLYISLCYRHVLDLVPYGIGNISNTISKIVNAICVGHPPRGQQIIAAILLRQHIQSANTRHQRTKIIHVTFSHWPLRDVIVNVYMITSSNGNIIRVTGASWGEFTCHRRIPLTKASDAELWYIFYIYAWRNGWVNNRNAYDLRRHRAIYDVTVMKCNFETVEYLLWNCSHVIATWQNSTLVQQIVWYRQIITHYLKQCWLRFVWSYGVTGSQRIKMHASHSLYIFAIGSSFLYFCVAYYP